MYSLLLDKERLLLLKFGDIDGNLFILLKGSNVDELNLRENEELEIIADGDGDGWLRARNSEGMIGMIPSNYIEILNSR